MSTMPAANAKKWTALAFMSACSRTSGIRSAAAMYVKFPAANGTGQDNRALGAETCPAGNEPYRNVTAGMMLPKPRRAGQRQPAL